MHIIIYDTNEPLYTLHSDALYQATVFEGSVDQFRDCFFDNASPDVIVGWALENGWTAVFQKGEKE